MSLLSTSTDKRFIKKVLGLPSNRDAVQVAKRVWGKKEEKARTKFDWDRAFKYVPTNDEIARLKGECVFDKDEIVILDPMAGGGSIPLEAVRLGIDTVCGDLNPVAYVILKATVEYPARFGRKLGPAVEEFCSRVHEAAKKELVEYFPKPDNNDVFSYLWTRTMRCPNCGLIVPLSPNWWIAKAKRGGVAAQPIVYEEDDVCEFEIITDPQDEGFNPDDGTVSGGDAVCPRCSSFIDGKYIKAEAQAGRMGHQLFCVCAKTPKVGRTRREWVFRAPTFNEIEAVMEAERVVKENTDAWIQNGIIPSERYPDDANDTRPIQYGMPYWRDLFSPRQLLTHATYIGKLQEEREGLFSTLKEGTDEWEFGKAITLYAAIVLDTCINYNSIQCRWDTTLQRIRSAMAMQAYPIKWSYSEFDHSTMLWPWAQKKTVKSLKDIIELLPHSHGSSRVYCDSATSIPLGEGHADIIVVDPPYHDNVMYAEVADFFYVWLKRCVGDLYPEAFRDELTNKDDEAVANRAHFKGMGRGQAKSLADEDYASKMESAFREMHRVLRDDGVMVVMFTHRKAEAWSGLAEGLMNAGFTFRASWPIHTEPGAKFGKVNKGMLKVTVFLYCRKRREGKHGRWEEVVDEIREVAEEKVRQYAAMGVTGPDLLVSVYGPALGVFADYHPVKDVSGSRKNADEALDIVSQVVNEFVTGDIKAADMETLAYLNLLRNFPGLTADYDAARLCSVFGGRTSVDSIAVGSRVSLVEKEKGKINILTARQRIERGMIDPDRPASLMVLADVVHAALVLYERKGMGPVKSLLVKTGRDAEDAGVLSVLEAIGRLGEAGAPDLVHDARVANALLSALGHEPEGVLKKGERLTHYEHARDSTLSEFTE